MTTLSQKIIYGYDRNRGNLMSEAISAGRDKDYLGIDSGGNHFVVQMDWGTRPEEINHSSCVVYELVRYYPKSTKTILKRVKLKHLEDIVLTSIRQKIIENEAELE